MKSLSTEQQDDYLQYARAPATWLFAARKHFAVADVIKSHLARSRGGSATSLEETAGCRDALYLHSGMAIENVAKAILIQKNPSVISQHGKLAKNLLGCKTGHEISILVESAIGELDPNDINLLKKLEEYLLWASRYTVPIDGARLYDREIKTRLRIAESNENEMIERIFSRLMEVAVASNGK